MNNNESVVAVDEVAISNEAVIPEKYDPLEKHVYPFWIKTAGLISGLLFLFLVPRFLLIDLPIRYEIYQKILQADTLFSDKKYESAVVIYEEVLARYPNFKHGKIKLAKSCFALLSRYNKNNFYQVGLHYLIGEKIVDSEVDEIKKFLPEEYREDFKSQFRKVK